MARSTRAACPAKQLDEVIARSSAGLTGAGVTLPTAAVDLACGDPGQSDPRTLRAPYRTITVPDRNRRAGEARTGWDDHRGGGEKEE
jgi:hypothetical protein